MRIEKMIDKNIYTRIIPIHGIVIVAKSNNSYDNYL